MKFILLRSITPTRVLVVFEGNELSDIMGLAKEIQKYKKKLGIKSKKIADDYSDIIICYVGLKGELAVSGYYGLEMCRDVHAGGDGGHDLVIPQYYNRTIQVKYTSTNAFYYRRANQFVSHYGILTQPARYTWVPKEYARELDDYTDPKKKFAARHVVISGVINRSIWNSKKKPIKLKTNNVGVEIKDMKDPVYFHDILEEQKQYLLEKNQEIDLYID